MQTYKMTITFILVTFLGACSSQDHYSRQNIINEDIKKQTKKDTASNSNPSVSRPEISEARPATRKPIQSSDMSVAAAGTKIDKLEKRSSSTPRVKSKQSFAMQETKGRLNAQVLGRSINPAAVLQQDINPYPLQPADRENYQHFSNSPIQLVSQHPVSTFSIDVDSGSYTNTRRILHDGKLPRHDAVRVEEFINYFSYDYPQAKNKKTPFSTLTEIGPNPWNPNTHLLHVGIKGYEVSTENLPAANLVFLVDVSGSMNSPNKLPLLKNALTLLSNKLRSQDSVAIVVYAGASGTVLQPTAGDRKADISAALHNLAAGGSTNGASGIRLAYQLARQAFKKNGINRVILATDGDFNVGTTNLEALKDLIKQQRQSDVTLTTLGFGRGNYNDSLMEQLADIGNGNYAYIDTLLEAQKSLVDQMGATLLTIAKDVKIQIEFNPAIVQEYRLVGYENRKLKREDFNNDKVDAGDIGAGHTVTAIYEISLVDGKGHRVDPLRYQTETSQQSARETNELAFVKIRYKNPQSDTSLLISHPIKPGNIKKSLAETTKRYQFSASVAAFGQLLRGGQYTQNFDLDRVIKLAQDSKGSDVNGYRGEFINLVKLANSLQGTTKVSSRH